MLVLIAVAAIRIPGQTAASNINAPTPRVITLAEAIDLALKQASNYINTQFDERIAAEDVRQAKSAFYPRVTAVPNVIYTTPSLGRLNGVPRPPSFLGANAITEYQALTNTAGEIDLSGKLKASLRRSEALLAAAKAGTEIARRELTAAVADAYYALALAATKRSGAEKNLTVAEVFEANIKLQLDAGEVAPVDLVRARLQKASRRDEFAQSQSDEIVAVASLAFLIGGKADDRLATVDLLTQLPQDGDIDLVSASTITTRPEFAQIDAMSLAAKQEQLAAKAARKPQFTYSVNTGFISDSLTPGSIRNSLGIQASVGVNFSIFDHGASRSRETQARLRFDQIENARQLASRNFQQAFYVARTQAIFAAQRINQIRGSIADAELNVTASEARYRAGEASIIEVIDAQNTLVTQKQSLYQAIFDYQTAKSRLQRAVGK